MHKMVLFLLVPVLAGFCQEAPKAADSQAAKSYVFVK